MRGDERSEGEWRKVKEGGCGVGRREEETANKNSEGEVKLLS